MGRWWLSVGALFAVLARAGVGAIDVQITTEDIQRATDLARWPHTDTERAQFHERYTVVVDSPVVEYFAVEAIEVITPFRRLELIAEEHARLNDLFARGGLHDAEEALRPWRDQVSIVAHLRFDQTRQIPGVPDADVTLEGPGGPGGIRPVFPISVSSSGVYGRNQNQRYLVGGKVDAVFDVRDVGQTTQPVVVRWKGKEVARAVLRFAAMQ
jgi:hypothetical protein